MPDENKFQKLREIGYRVTVTCAFCVHGHFQWTGAWGECRKHRYYHQKHDNPPEGRGVSVLLSGTCPDAQLDSAWESQFGAHSEFLDKG